MKNRRIMNTKTLVTAGLLTALSIILTRVFSIQTSTLRLGFGDIPLILSGLFFGPIVGALTGIVADLTGIFISLKGSFHPGFTLSSAMWGFIPGLMYPLLKSKDTKINFKLVNTGTILVLATALVGYLFNKETLSINNGGVFLSDQKIHVAYIILYIIVVLAFIIVPLALTRNQEKVQGTYQLDKILFILTICYMVISLGLNSIWLNQLYGTGFIALLPGRILRGLVIIPLHALIVHLLSRYFKYMN